MNQDQSGKQRFELSLLEKELAICRLPSGAGLPAWAAPGKGTARGPLTSITWTAEETSVVCPSRLVPADIRADHGWRALALAGPLDLNTAGVLASLTGPLAEAEVAVFTISTHDTDYLLIKGSSLEAAIETLETAGHKVR